MEKQSLNIEDVPFLIDSFYKKVLKDERIGYIFNEVAQLDFEHHMPKLYRFWESVLFGVASYKGNPMLVHIELNQKEKLTTAHFNRWIFLWQETITELFVGEKAEEAKQKAQQIRLLMQMKIERSEGFKMENHN